MQREGLEEREPRLRARGGEAAQHDALGGAWRTALRRSAQNFQDRFKERVLKDRFLMSPSALERVLKERVLESSSLVERAAKNAF